MQNDKQTPIKPAYPLGDANVESSPKPDTTPKKDPKAAPEPVIVNEPQTDG